MCAKFFLHLDHNYSVVTPLHVEQEYQFPTLYYENKYINIFVKCSDNTDTGISKSDGLELCYTRSKPYSHLEDQKTTSEGRKIRHPPSY